MNLAALKGKVFEFQNSTFRFLLRTRFPIEQKPKVEFVGNGYSGYWFPTEWLRLQGTIWGVGLGEDSSFEYELQEKGYRLYGFEPEKKCFQASQAQFAGKQVSLFNYGLWDKSGRFKFTGENISIVNIFNLDAFSEEELEIYSLWDIAKELDLESLPQPRILKMNIEGAEREILLRFCEEPLSFDVIIFQAEFLFHVGFREVRRKIRAFKELSFIISKLLDQKWNITSINRNQITISRVY